MVNKPKATSTEIAQLAYLLIKEAGICAACRKAWAVKRHIYCEECRRYFKRYYKEHGGKWIGRN